MKLADLAENLARVHELPSDKGERLGRRYREALVALSSVGSLERSGLT